MKKEPVKTRFELIHNENITPYFGTAILRDTQSGVQYLFACNSSGGGLTPLLDAEGKPIVEKGSE